MGEGLADVKGIKNQNNNAKEDVGFLIQFYLFQARSRSSFARAK